MPGALPGLLQVMYKRGAGNPASLDPRPRPHEGGDDGGKLTPGAAFSHRNGHTGFFYCC
jgi:hypothetical protein